MNKDLLKKVFNNHEDYDYIITKIKIFENEKRIKYYIENIIKHQFLIKDVTEFKIDLYEKVFLYLYGFQYKKYIFKCLYKGLIKKSENQDITINYFKMNLNKEMMNCYLKISNENLEINKFLEVIIDKFKFKEEILNSITNKKNHLNKI